MKVRMKAERRIKVNDLSTRIFPAGKVLDVDDDIGAVWVAEGAADDVTPKAPAVLTDEETEVLKSAAQQILAESPAPPKPKRGRK